MQNATLRLGTLALMFSLTVAGCGGGKRAASDASNAMQNAATRAGGAMESTRAETGSPAMHCGAVKPVWVNTKSGAYHEPGDPYYGHTKEGKYMCPSAARAAGYHASGSSHTKHSATTEQQ